MVRIILACLLLAGCGATPYFDVGMSYNLDEMSDWYLRSERDWTCSNKESFHAELGLEFDHQWTVGYHHQSHLTCGGPFNSHPELYQDEIMIMKRFGGRK